MKTYWNKSGSHQELYDELFNRLIPLDGFCPTLFGEYLRAISKIYYDGYNNGFCNNTSGPYNFLVKEFGMLEVYPDFEKLSTIVNSGYSRHMTAEIATVLEDSVNIIVEYILENEDIDLNMLDMWNYSDPTNYDEIDEDE